MPNPNSSSAPTPFNFTRHFDAPRGGAEIAETLRAAEIDAARAAAREQGFAEGVVAAQENLQGQQVVLLAGLAERLSAFVQGMETARADMQAQAIYLAHEIAKAIAGEALTNFPQARILSLIAQVLDEHLAAPRIVVRLHPSMLESLRAQLEDMTIAHGFHGKLILLGEPSLAETDAEMEWALGGAVMRTADQARAIAEKIQNLLLDAPLGAAQPVEEYHG